jgi:hypothetical protein
MGLFDRLSKEGRAKSAIEKNAKKVLNKHIQHEDRFAAMEKLREAGHAGEEDAIIALARRYSYVYDKTILDEKEKAWVTDVLVGMGPKAVGALRRYAKSADTLSQVLWVLERIADRATLLSIIDELLEREEPGYTRDPSKKIQILLWLGEWKGASDAEIVKRILPYVADFDETVRFTAVESLDHHKDDANRDALLDALVRPEEESRRLKVRVAEALVAGGWKVSDKKEAVSALLDSELPEFGMSHDKLVKKGR